MRIATSAAKTYLPIYILLIHPSEIKRANNFTIVKDGTNVYLYISAILFRFYKSAIVSCNMNVIISSWKGKRQGCFHFFTDRMAEKLWFTVYNRWEDGRLNGLSLSPYSFKRCTFRSQTVNMAKRSSLCPSFGDILSSKPNLPVGY
jgi:hypothetical protein